MTPKEFKPLLEDLMNQAAADETNYKTKMLYVGILEYSLFAFKLGIAEHVRAANEKQEAEGKTPEVKDGEGFSV